MKKSLLLASMIVLFFGCEKGQEKINLVKGVYYGTSQSVNDTESSVTENSSILSDHDIAILKEKEIRREFVDKLSDSLADTLKKGTTFFSHSTTELKDSDFCKNTKEIFRKVEVRESNLIITDVINYLSKPKITAENVECNTDKYENVSIIKKGLFSIEGLAKEINSNYGIINGHFKELGFGVTEYNIRNPESEMSATTFGLGYVMGVSKSNENVLFMVIDPNTKFELHTRVNVKTLLNYDISIEHIVTFYTEGSDSIAESGFNEYFNGENVQINESDEYLQIFNIEAE